MKTGPRENAPLFCSQGVAPRAFTAYEILWMDTLNAISLTLIHRCKDGVEAVAATLNSLWEEKRFMDEIDKSIERLVWVYPSDRLDSKTRRFWMVLWISCTCGIGCPHDPDSLACCFNNFGKCMKVADAHQCVNPLPSVSPRGDIHLWAPIWKKNNHRLKIRLE